MDNQYLRNIFLIKIVRITRLGKNLLDVESVKRFIQAFYEPGTRDAKVYFIRELTNYVKISNQIFYLL